MNQISAIRPLSDAEAGRLVSPETLADLADRITAIPVTRSRRPARGLGRRPWGAGIVLAGGLAAAFLVAVGIGISGTTVGPVSVGPSNAQALSFVTDGGYIIVRVRNPLADPARYRAEFAAHRLNIKLQMVPSSPSVAGTVVFFGGTDLGQITPITAAGKCFTGGGSNVCPVGLRIPVNFHGSADLGFGRAARPGEQYESAGQVTAPGEAMHGLTFKGRTVGTLLALLNARHVTVPQYRWQTAHDDKVLRPNQVPSSWHVYYAIPWAPQQVLLFVGPSARTP